MSTCPQCGSSLRRRTIIRIVRKVELYDGDDLQNVNESRHYDSFDMNGEWECALCNHHWDQKDVGCVKQDSPRKLI
ncbi:MAG: hypothetical protein PVI90_00500 [Desulfobacteraceae bacterium]|jgi:hypothetical protein